MSNEEEVLNGALLAGADGAVYFIPDSRLSAFRLPDAQAAMARSAIENESEVSGFAMTGQVGGANILTALQGPLAIRPKLGSTEGVAAPNCVDPDDEPTQSITGFRFSV